MKSFAELDIDRNGNYLKLLSAVSRLSGLFSDSSTPLINYRVAENIFCQSFKAINLSRSDTSFDAKLDKLGIGLKTFVCSSDNKSEKIAEFNSLSRELSQFRGIDLAQKLSESRNNRIEFAKGVYDIDNSMYHIVARKEKELLLFETDYNVINTSNITLINDNETSLQFEDGTNFYSFNYSKNTLFRKFIIPSNVYRLPIEIIEDPFTLLLGLFENNYFKSAINNPSKGLNYIILPLYGIDNQKKTVFERSGLNQWNANGRKRDVNEVYIPVPAKIHHLFPDFFPSIESDKNHFNLHLPNNTTFEASICQTAIIDIAGEKVNKGKGLMTKSNKGLGDWLLRKALQLKEYEVVTIEMLEKVNIDSVIIIKEDESNYKIDIMKTDSYENFINNINN